MLVINIEENLFVCPFVLLASHTTQPGRGSPAAGGVCHDHLSFHLLAWAEAHHLSLSYEIKQ